MRDFLGHSLTAFSGWGLGGGGGLGPTLALCKNTSITYDLVAIPASDHILFETPEHHDTYTL